MIIAILVGFPTILIAFVIWGVCSVPEVEEGEPIYDESDGEKDSESESEASESPEEENIDQKDKPGKENYFDSPKSDSCQNFFHGNLIIFHRPAPF